MRQGLREDGCGFLFSDDRVRAPERVLVYQEWDKNADMVTAPRRLLQALAHPELVALSAMAVRDANVLRSDAVQAAFRSLPPRQQGSLQVQAEWLATEIPNLGPTGALEVLAAIGVALDDAKKE